MQCPDVRPGSIILIWRRTDGNHIESGCWRDVKRDQEPMLTLVSELISEFPRALMVARKLAKAGQGSLAFTKSYKPQ